MFYKYMLAGNKINAYKYVENSMQMLRLPHHCIVEVSVYTVCICMRVLSSRSSNSLPSIYLFMYLFIYQVHILMQKHIWCYY